MRPKKRAVHNRDIGAKGGATSAARRSELDHQDIPAAAAGPSTADSSEDLDGEDVFSYDPETLHISGAPDGLDDNSYPLEFLAGHNPNGREGIGDVLLYLNKTVEDTGRYIIHAGDQPISHYGRFHASLYGVERFLIVMDLFHNSLIKPLEWVQDLGWVAFIQKFYKGLGMAKEGYRSSDIYNIYNLCNLLHESYNSHGVKDMIAATLAAIDVSDPARQAKMDLLVQLDDLLGYWIPLAMWGVALYNNCIKAPTVEERRRWFGEYIQVRLLFSCFLCKHACSLTSKP